jgi:dihydropteroate synthase
VGGLFFELDDAVARGRELYEQGADVLDIGGESTRPPGTVYGAGAEPVSAEEEIRRVKPVVQRLAQEVGVGVSIDTFKPEVARVALGAGARIVNDVTGGRSAELLRVVAEHDAELVLMHNRGRGEVQGDNIRYEDVVQDVIAELGQAVQRALEAGVERHRIWIDPGIGFAKTSWQSAELLARTGELVGTGLKVLVGPSRKSFIAALAPDQDGSAPSPTQRLGGTAAALTVAVLGGAHAVRVHDVADMRQTVRVAESLRELGR